MLRCWYVLGVCMGGPCARRSILICSHWSLCLWYERCIILNLCDRIYGMYGIYRIYGMFHDFALQFLYIMQYSIFGFIRADVSRFRADISCARLDSQAPTLFDPNLCFAVTTGADLFQNSIIFYAC